MPDRRRIEAVAAFTPNPRSKRASRATGDDAPLPTSFQFESDYFLSVGVSKVVINDQEAFAEFVQ